MTDSRETRQERAELLDAAVQHVISAVRCDSSFPTGSFVPAILSALKDAREEGRRETDRNSSLGGTDWEDL
jgi:hypothetical protein